MACGPPLSPGVRAGEGPGVGALPPAGRHVCCLWRSRGIQDGVGALGAGGWGGVGGHTGHSASTELCRGPWD